MNNISSPIFNNAVEQLSSLPGVGKKTALRLVLHLLNQNINEIKTFGEAFISLANDINYCKHCYNISEKEVCGICNHPKRNKNLICVVENVLDVIAIENTGQYNGVYHVLGGKISPMEGIGPNDIRIKELLERIENDDVTEIIMALSTTMEGDATNYYIYKKIAPFNLQTTTIARGIGIGDELEYTDELTLGRSIVNRIPFENTLTIK